MINVRPVKRFSLSDVIHEWDALAPLRWDQILSGVDITFNRVLVPQILGLLPPRSRSMTALDAGCGIGASTRALIPFFRSVDAVDPSPISVQLARQLLPENETQIFESSLEDYASGAKKRYDVIIANMVLMDVPNLKTFVTAVRTLLRPGGMFIFSTTHPYFWPAYYGYEEESWFRYMETIYVRAPFRISNDRDTVLLSTHVHRPLSSYFNILGKARLRTDAICEPVPTPDVESLYREPWKNPRYLVARCRRPKSILK